MNQQRLVLVVDDEQTQRRTVAGILEGWGHEVKEAGSGREALDALAGQAFDLVLTDLRMPGMTGLQLLKECRAVRPDVAVVVMTAFGSIETAVEAMKSGAADFLTKPIDLDQLEVVVKRTLEMKRLIRENKLLRRRLEETSAGFKLIGRSRKMAEVLNRAARAAETDATVLIRGESGTGKELLARSLHDLSPRADRPFVAVNCAALPETLLESELFGHVKGSFTGADRDRPGRVAAAEGGTIFLDEIGDVSPLVQVKLLRFLQEREYSPVGSDLTLRADVRVVTATHRDLPAAVAAGSFREDLFFRLKVVGLDLPPLRERREDIPELAALFLERFAQRYQRPARRFSSEAMACLMSHPFRGNIRELENVIEQAVVMARDVVIQAEDLSCAGATPPGGGAESGVPTLANVEGNLPGVLEALERRIVMETLAAFSGNQSSAARHLGLTESGLRYKLSKWRETDDAG
ncbi:MAG: sigma-54-dependent transcriptional regulator [Candidatus Krumholzibacteriia bacterium]